MAGVTVSGNLFAMAGTLTWAILFQHSKIKKGKMDEVIAYLSTIKTTPECFAGLTRPIKEITLKSSPTSLTFAELNILIDSVEKTVANALMDPNSFEAVLSDLTPSAVRSVFYYIDLHKPTRLLTLTETKNESYSPESLTTLLAPPRKNKCLLGQYYLCQSFSNFKVYIYGFNKTQVASKATIESIGPLVEKSVELNAILPPVAKPIVVLELRVDEYAIPLSVCLTQIEKFRARDATVNVDDIRKVATRAPETLMNKWILNQLKASGLFKDYDVLGNKSSSSGNKHFCRYSLSREDFGIYPHELNGEEIRSGSVSLTEDEEEEEMDSDTNGDTNDDTNDDTNGDTNDDTNSDSVTDGSIEMEFSTTGDVESDQWQLLANMLKTATELAYKTIRSGNVLFKKIEVYGILIDYKTQCSKKTAQLDLDFINKRSTIYWSHDSLGMDESFMRLHDKLSTSLVRRV